MAFDNLRDGINAGILKVKGIFGANPLTSIGVATGAGVVLGAGVAGLIASSRKRSKKTKRSSKKKRKSKSRKLKFGSKAYRKKYLGKRRGRKLQRSPRTAGRGKDTSQRRIRYTKNNQPYIILSSGKARFIKKSSVRRSRKRKGGKY